MNIYVVVEGEVGEKQVYRVWIPCVNNQLTFSPEIDMVKNNNFHIVHGGGFPNYFTVIENAIKDISLNLDTNENRLFGRLVVGVDSEENSYDQRRSDIDSFIKKALKKYDVKDLDYRIIVQDFCLEAWGLGNRKIINPSVNKGELGKFTKHYNVRKMILNC